MSGKNDLRTSQHQSNVSDQQKSSDSDTTSRIEVEGNADAKILAKTFEQLIKNGLSESERKKIEKVDELLTDADIVISKSGDRATIAQENGRTFTVKPTVRGR